MSAEQDKKDLLREQQTRLYAQAGVDYDTLDLVKRHALEWAKSTSHNLKDMKEVGESRGESAYVVEFPDHYLATVLECLGAKSLVADAMRHITGKTYYNKIAQCTVAMAVNDIFAMGAKPFSVNAYWAVGSSEWFADRERSFDLINGWANACNLAGVSWGGGESPAISGIVAPDAIDLACSCNGIIKPKERLVSAQKIQPGDVILIAESNGIHANGLSLARKLATVLPEGYATRINKKRMYGEALLDPTTIYRGFINDLQRTGIDIHYMSNITGHGLRKIMRANRDLTYVLENLPDVPPVLSFIQEKLGMSDEVAYATFNMGSGFAVIVPAEQAESAIFTCKVSSKYRYKQSLTTYEVIRAGYVKEGPKRVVIEPKNIVYEADSLQIR